MTVQPHGRVLADLLPRSAATNAALVVGGTALVGVLAQVSVPLWPVPITGQTLGVILVGASLGARRGAASLALYLVGGLAGLPIFANFTGGPLSVMKPSFGFVIGFVIAAYAIGWFAEHNWGATFWKSLAAFSIGSVIPFLVGVPYLGLMLGHLGQPNDLGTLMALGVTPFLLGGAIKALLAAGLLPLCWKAVRRIDRAR
ncbi:biotin transporter BioY [Georgenia thermotolerans]|uniref:Biotin transporter n=1 Tax=Georgenia thermotolerans TaxID=527326 RepID=A0A7J5UUJ4_9MICO|nr:biotin transporter BioY [Georgenia thermotolerans]